MSMTMKDLLELLAGKYDDWLNMARSFGVSKDDAMELVQEMFIRIDQYVDDPQRIMYNETEVNTFYIYITLRNIYVDNHLGFGKRANKIETFSQLPESKVNDLLNSIIDDSSSYFEDSKEEAFNLVLEKVDEITKNWYWYDKKLFDIYFHTDMSMRDISKETQISLSSIFNTLSNAKRAIKKSAKDSYKKYKETRG